MNRLGNQATGKQFWQLRQLLEMPNRPAGLARRGARWSPPLLARGPHWRPFLYSALAANHSLAGQIHHATFRGSALSSGALCTFHLTRTEYRALAVTELVKAVGDLPAKGL